MQRDGPRPAGTLEYFAMQNLRHAGPVAGVRTVTQGLAAPALARLVQSDPRAALGVQLAVSITAALRRGAAQWHSESQVDVANQAFAGDSAHGSSVARRAWQAAQTVMTTGGDAAATALTGLSIAHPALTVPAQAMASIQLRAHMLSMLREFLRPTINTVQVGNHGPHATWPAEGRNLRLDDIGALARLGFGTAAGALEFGAQVGMQLVLARQPAWNAATGWAALAGLIAGAANMLTSSVEDHLIDTAVARSMQRSDPTHVPHVHFESRNPLTRRELGRQFERVDARVLNQMLPAMLAAAVMQGLQPLMQRHQVGTVGQVLAQAAVNALMTGLVLGLLLAKTVQTYQLNDALREHRTRPQDTPT
ncbi:hypothetical protein DZC73_20685 [Albitalea terrae]|uniref:Uncharacterized protein n=2 Tax=Piscinibacter terrae TaxID=2496871 RepID=A0A3N7JNJ6_9BURK|nr:hypothetical protein DZC73_20685 [Albitalea terrae]